MSRLKSVQHLPDSSTFQIGDGNSIASLNYELIEKKMTIQRTFVPEELRGQGLAALLTEAALSFAKESGLSVRSNCSYVDRYMERHKLNN